MQFIGGDFFKIIPAFIRGIPVLEIYSDGSRKANLMNPVISFAH